MTYHRRSSRTCVLLGVVVSVVLSGCAINMKVPIKDPAPSRAQYVKPPDAAPTTFVFTDARTPQNKANPVTGRIPMQLRTPDDKPFEPVPWLASTTVKELTARGLPVRLGDAPSGAQTVAVRLIQIENRRVSGWSPFETFTSVSADVVTDKGTRRVVAFVMRGKVPVWSFDEVIDPTYNDPLDLAAKELATKVNQILFDAKVADAQVDDLIARTDGATVNFRDVYELGFGNNARAIPQLVKLSGNKEDEIVRAAMSSLGILRAEQQFDLLAGKAANSKEDWENRALALKAIGDLGTPQSRAYLEKERTRLENLTDAESVRTKGLIGLYLD